jgi:hypothetical protein
MALHTSYGDGGFCENCDNTHDHPLHNIVAEYEIDDPEPTEQERARISAMAKLKALGLSDSEVAALLGS